MRVAPKRTGQPGSPTGADRAVSGSPAPRFDQETAVVLKSASILLDYPTGRDDDLDLIRRALHEAVGSEATAHLSRFLDWYGPLSPRDRETAYVATFELGAPHTLYLTAPGTRDKRQRGRELLRLKAFYRRAGMTDTGGELPDYLPLVLEFASLQPEGLALLEERRACLEALAASLAKASSPFASLLGAVLCVMEAER